ncbi:MAG TPA: urate hydroxylase PuuD [Patescibacteria group bacterium]|nr:urate hydroxylase PuuD [Patescibacteria group bacterium]
MNESVMTGINLAFRWLHVVAGVMWIGHLYFFNFVNAQLAKTYDADSKKKVIPELMPRALYWFRWGAAWTWISGIVLFGLVYSMGGTLVPAESQMTPGMATALSLAALAVGFLVYDLLWKSPIKSNQVAGTVVSLALLTVTAWGLSTILSTRAVFIVIGAILGTIMASNVWMRIWPSQRKIIAAIKAGQAPDAALVGLAGMRSKHNTYMSVPLILLMVSNHYPTVYGSDYGWLCAIGLVIVGFLVTMWLYAKSGSAAPGQF